MTFTAPFATGAGEVVLTMDDGAVMETTGTSELNFTFVNISLIAPASGQRGTLVTITGVGLDVNNGGIARIDLAGIRTTVFGCSPCQEEALHFQVMGVVISNTDTSHKEKHRTYANQLQKCPIY